MTNYLIKLAISVLILVSISSCGSGGDNNEITSPASSITKTEEVWKGSLDDGQISANIAIGKNVDGTFSASGNWQITSNGYVISCPFTDGAATVTQDTLSFNISGEATAMGGTLDGIQYPKFKITANGIYLNGATTSGTYTVTFKENPPKTSPDVVLPSPFSGGLWLTKQSGAGITYIAPAGTYSGTYSGADMGTWQLVIDEHGKVDGALKSSIYKDTYYLFGNHNIDGSLSMQTRTENGTTYFTGHVNSVSGVISGTWKTPAPGAGNSGSFSGAKE